MGWEASKLPIPPFRGSSAVERLAVNQFVGGSIPPLGAMEDEDRGFATKTEGINGGVIFLISILMVALGFAFGMLAGYYIDEEDRVVELPLVDGNNTPLNAPTENGQLIWADCDYGVFYRATSKFVDGEYDLRILIDHQEDCDADETD
jgi:hypothetical protein